MQTPNYTAGSPVHVKINYLNESDTIEIYLNHSEAPSITYQDSNAFDEGYVMLALTGGSMDNISITGTYQDQTIQTALDRFILYKPLRDETKIKWPQMPESVRVEMVSSEPAGYIDSDWNVIKRPEAGQDDVTVAVEVKFTVGDTSIVKEYSVPISAVYVAPEVDEEAVAAAHAAQSQKKLGMFVHYVQHFTQDPNGKLMTDVDALANAFDAEQFAKDMDAFGVEYVLFTCMHYNAETLYPSDVNRRWRDDRHAAGSDSKKSYSDRDVILDLYYALSKYDVELQLRVPGLVYHGRCRNY